MGFSSTQTYFVKFLVRAVLIGHTQAAFSQECPSPANLSGIYVLILNKFERHCILLFSATF